MSLQQLFNNLDDLIRTPEDVVRLNAAILQLAIRGKLVRQDDNDEPADRVLRQITELKQPQFSTPNLGLEPVGAEPTKRQPSPYELPKGWIWTSLGDATSSRDAERIPLSKEVREGRKGIYDYYGASGVIDRIDGYLFDKPLLLIGEDGANLVLRSTPIAFIARGKYWVNNHAHVLDSLDETVLEYIRLYINATDLRPYVTGTAQPKMNQAKMNSIPVALPPYKEQHRIVAKVDELLAQTRALEARLRRAQEEIVVVNQAALHRLETAEDPASLHAAWHTISGAFDLLYNDPRPLAALRQTILQLAVSGRLTGYTAQSHEGKPLEQIADVQGGIQKSPSRRGVGSPVRYITVAHLQGGRINPSDKRYFELSQDEVSKWRLETGDVLVVEGNGSADHIGKSAVFRNEIQNCVYQNHLIRVRPARDVVTSEYLNLYLSSPKGRSQLIERSRTSSGLFNLSVGRLKTVNIAVPPLAEQRRIVVKVDELLGMCDALERHLDRSAAAQKAAVASVLAHLSQQG